MLKGLLTPGSYNENDQIKITVALNKTVDFTMFELETFVSTQFATIYNKGLAVWKCLYVEMLRILCL